MKPGDKVKIEITKSELLEELEKKRVAEVRLILKSAEIMELENKGLTFIRDSTCGDNFVIVKTPEGNEYEVHKDLLKEIK